MAKTQTKHKKLILQLPKVILLLFGLILMLSAVLTGSRLHQLKSQALEPITPRGLVISNLTSTSATVSWYTRVPVNSYIVVKDSQNKTFPAFMDDRVSDINSGRFYTHYVTVRGLKSQENYQFVIYSDGSQFRSYLAKPMEFSTLPDSQTPPPPPQNIFGRVVDTLGQPANDVILYAYPGTGTIISAITDDIGGYVLNLRSSRDLTTGTSLVSLGDKIKMSVIQGEEARSDIVVDLNEEGLIPTIKLGKNYDFSINYPPENQTVNQNEIKIEGTGSAGKKIRLKLK